MKFIGYILIVIGIFFGVALVLDISSFIKTLKSSQELSYIIGYIAAYILTVILLIGLPICGGTFLVKKQKDKDLGL